MNFLKNRGKQILKVENEKKSYIPFKEKGNKYTTETKLYQYVNKVSMFEIVKEVDEKTVTKENNISLARNPTASLISGNVEHSDKINTWLMIEADVTKDEKTIGQLKYYSVFLLNDV